MTTDGHNLHTNAYQQGKSDSAVNRINEKTLSTPTAAEVAADMVAKIMKEDSLRNDMALAAIEKSKNYSVDEIYNKWMEIMKKIDEK